MLLVLPLSLALATPASTCERFDYPRRRTSRSAQALREAFGHRSYVLLVLGFFTCGFQLAFVTVHLPAYLLDRGLSNEIGAWTIAVIGLCNIVGSLSSGWLAEPHAEAVYAVGHLPRSRAVDCRLHYAAATPTIAIIYGAVTGLLWLSTVPPTSGLVAVMFGTRWLAMLFGFAFFSHQVGGFLGVLIGGIAFERTGPTIRCGGCRCSSVSSRR